MSSPEQNEHDLNERLTFAMQLAQRCLTNEGKIDYAVLPSERLEVLREVGLVTEPAEQEPIHLVPDQYYTDEDTDEEILIRPSYEVFYTSCNNFSVHFDVLSHHGKLYREQIHARRFRALFPEFDEALAQARQRYKQAQKDAIIAGRIFHHKDEPYERGLQTAYAVMSQLVDENDPVALGTIVRESSNRHVMLTA